MKHILMKNLLKAKGNKTLEVEELIEQYLADVASTNKKQTEEFVADLLVYVMQHLEDKKDKDLILSMVETKLTHLSYTIDSSTVEEIYNKTALTTAVGIKAVFTFDKKDAKVIESVNRSLLWLKEDGTKNTQDKLKKVITSAMNGDITTAQIGDKLREEFTDVMGESARYFTGVSDHIIRQSQSLTRIDQYQKAGIEYVQVIAKIDTHTSTICKSMHKRIIPIGHLTNQSSAILSATNIEEKKSAAQWQSAPIFGKLPADVGMAPYHFGCRTVMVAYFPETETIDGKNVNGSFVAGDEYNGKEVLYSHRIPHFDKETILTKNSFDHGGNEHGLTDKTVIAGLNSVESMAIHATNAKRVVAYSRDKNLFFALEDGEVVTVFAPSRKENYFKDEAKTDTIESKSIRKADDENM